MKNRIFSIICFIASASIPIYLMLAPLWLSAETFVYTSNVIGSLTTSILLAVVGVANMPKNKNETK